MNQAHLTKYLEIIQELLTCPSGEEWVRLKRHEDWVNPEFVQVMEQVAAQLTREGNQDAARFLHNWAAKLHHILVKEVNPSNPEADRDQAYLALIQALLDCPEGTERRILAEHQALIGPGLVQKMYEIAQQLQQQGANEAATYLHNLAVELSRTWIKAHAFQPNLEKEVSSPLPKVSAHKPEGISPEQAPQAEAPAIPPPLTPPAPPVSPASPPSSRSASVANGKLNPAPPASPASPPSPALTLNQQLADSLREITQALHQLNQTLTAPRTTESATQNPLWYMEALEQAHTSKWLLTTEEVEQLIGVKPRCHGPENSYQRGTWQFVKVGKVGTQTAWQVVKAQLEEVRPPEDHASHPASQNGQPGNGRLKTSPLTAQQSTQPNKLDQTLDSTDTEDLWAE
jgi:hypothetical protein